MRRFEVVSRRKKSDPSAEERAVKEPVRLVGVQGFSLTGVDSGESWNVRNETRPKMVLTQATGRLQIEVPRARDGSLEPVFVKKRQHC
jgi:hypothetical protein